MSEKHLLKQWSVALYEAKSWTILKAYRSKIEAFETWCWRRVLKINN